MASQVHDVIDVLDRHRARLDAGPAGDAIPHRLLRHRPRDQGRQVRPPARPLAGGSAGPHDRSAVREHLIAQAHDHQFRRQELPGRERRTGILTAAALGARERVEHLLPGQVRGGPRAEADVLLGDVRVVEAQRFKPSARSGPAVPNVERRAGDVQML